MSILAINQKAPDLLSSSGGQPVGHLESSTSWHARQLTMLPRPPLTSNSNWRISPAVYNCLSGQESQALTASPRDPLATSLFAAGTLPTPVRSDKLRSVQTQVAMNPHSGPPAQATRLSSMPNLSVRVQPDGLLFAGSQKASLCRNESADLRYHMNRLLLVVAVLAFAGPSYAADPPSPLAERFLHEGRSADGETASLLALDANPADDEARFGLGVIQFVRAVENLGKAMYEYGAVSENATQPFLRLPVPRNEKPSAVSYQELGRVLDALAADLGRAEATLADIKDDNVKLRLRLAQITFDFTGAGNNSATLLEILMKLTGGRLNFQEANPAFRIHFDRGDVAWLRAYCHLLCAMVESYRTVDEEVGFEQRVEGIFPKVEVSTTKPESDWWQGLRVVDTPRMRRMRLHLVAVCELNRETWTHIRMETDNDYEWLPHPKQTDQLGLPLTDERINGWLAMMSQLEELLKGERLVPSNLLRIVDTRLEPGQGLDLKRLLDDPPADLFNYGRIQEKGIDGKYLQAEKGKPVLSIDAVLAAIRLLDGPFGFAYAARLN